MHRTILVSLLVVGCSGSGSGVASTGASLDGGAPFDGAAAPPPSAADGGTSPGDSDAGAAEGGSGEGGGASDASGDAGVWRPKPGTSWQWQLSGTLDTSLSVQVYDIDLFDNAASVIAGLQSRGIKVVCYLDAGSWEPNRPDSSQFPAAVQGSAMVGWPDEKWLDIRSPIVQGLIAKRMDLAAQKGCDGVEPDNVDGFANSTGFPLTAADQLAFNRFLAGAAHARNLAVALKNDPAQVADLVTDFDFELDEQCFQYSECDSLKPFIQAGKAVFEVEYGAASLAPQVCPQANADDFDTLIKNMNLDATRTSCR